MLFDFIDASNWTHEQWLAASILVFAVVLVLLVLHRMMKIFRMTRKSDYQPNLRPLRRKHYRNKTEPANHSDQD